MSISRVTRKRIWTLGFCGFWVMALPVLALAGRADVKAVSWSPHAASAGCHMNMGPTGARVWMRGFQFEIMAVDAGSPADGVLSRGDLVLGVAGTNFSATADSRMALGSAIGRAEATDGALHLTIQRDGHQRGVSVKLPVTGPFSATWPYGCAKSQRILDETCVYLREAQLPDGSIVTDGGMGTYLAGLLFLASGEPRYRDGARRAVYATAATELEKLDYHNWALGYGGLLLAEYYLATGDTNVLPRLKAITDHLARGQMQCGSWGHSGPSAGYGALNQPGLVCTITLALAQECGVEIDRAALQRAVSFYGRYAELGAVPYGDHMPGVSIPDDNGKSSVAAVLFSLLPGRQEASSAFVQSVATSYWLREEGHTGGFFSMLWGPLACGLARAVEFQTFMDYQGWYYNLCRTWRGSMVMLPYQEALTRFDESTYTGMDGEFTTGGLALTFALPHHQLRILGAPTSVFGAALSGPMLKARQSYQARQWAMFNTDLAAAREAAGSPEEKRWLTQLEAAAAMLQADTRRTLKEIENNLAEGDSTRASEQYLALKRFLGDKDETILALDKRFADATVQWHMRTGNQYYKAWRDLRGITVITWLPYGDMAKAHVGEVPKLRPPLWESLLPVSGKTTREWRKSGGGEAVAGELPFILDTTDYDSLRIQLQSPRNAHTRVYLNGTQVADVVRGQRSGYARIVLDASARSLLQVGTNMLSLSSTSVGGGGNALDVGLDGMPRERPLAMTPARAGDKGGVPPTPDVLRATLEKARHIFPVMLITNKPDPAIPERLCVRDSQDRFRMALEAEFNAMSLDGLGVALRSPVAYWRYLASQSLSRRGDTGLQVAAAGLHDADWRVRSACCDAFTIRVDVATKAGEAGTLKPVEPAVVTRLRELVGDGNAWVRCRAAGTLGALGKADTTVAAALVKATLDSDSWVRAAALGALGKLTDDPRILVQAAVGALLLPDTSFSVVGRSLPLIMKYGADDKAVIPGLVYALEHPGEGEGSQRLNEIMPLLIKLDPDGSIAVPTITRVAAGGYAYDRLKGSPRTTAIELLGGMGIKAASAVPVLKTIMAGTNAKEQPLRDAAKNALERIGQAKK